MSGNSRSDEGRANARGSTGRPGGAHARAVVLATQAGLPLTPRPYHEAAARAGLDANELMQTLSALLDRGAVRRVAAVPNHYALGYRANGMSVWDVDDARIGECGRAVGALPFVSHCYRRPRRPPAWNYNLFAMVHARDREEVEAKVERIAALLGDAVRDHDVLYSRRILKKTGLRLSAGTGDFHPCAPSGPFPPHAMGRAREGEKK